MRKYSGYSNQIKYIANRKLLRLKLKGEFYPWRRFLNLTSKSVSNNQNCVQYSNCINQIQLLVNNKPKFSTTSWHFSKEFAAIGKRRNGCWAITWTWLRSLATSSSSVLVSYWSGRRANPKWSRNASGRVFKGKAELQLFFTSVATCSAKIFRRCFVVSWTNFSISLSNSNTCKHTKTC